MSKRPLNSPAYPKVLVCGGRTFGGTTEEREFFATIMNQVCEEMGTSELCIIEGGAAGADYLTRHWARSHGLSLITCTADWGKYGKAAGPIRNKLMLTRHAPELVIAFPGGRGTANMVSLVIQDAGDNKPELWDLRENMYV